MPNPTHEEIAWVRAWECGQSGHSFDVIVEKFPDIPVRVLCSNCGASWAVESAITNSTSQLHNYEPTPGPDAVCRHCHQRDFHRLHNKLTDRKSMSDVIEQLEQERQIWLDLSKSEKHRTTKASMDGTIHGLSIALRIVKNNSSTESEG